MKQNIFLLVAVVFLCNVLTAQTTTVIPNGATAPQLPLPVVPAAYDAGKKINIVRTWEARKAVTDGSEASLNNNANFKTATAYFDGLGRPIQTVVKGNNYDGTKDIVSMNVYDEFNRETKQYLPYAPASGSNGKFRLNPFAEQQTYYNANYQDQTPFGKAEIESSPLNRPLKSYAPGNSWAGSNRGSEQQFAINTVLEDIRIITIGYTAGAIPLFGNAYPTGDLLKAISVDEHGKKVVEYKNKQGQTILKKVQLQDNPGVSYTGWLCTYYIYDDFNRLRYVIQPKGVEWLTGNGWSLSAQGGTQVRDELCFIYEYDIEGRMIYKKVPGAAAVLLCYDKRDRLVFSQDGLLRTQGRWMTTSYDVLDRPIATALFNQAQTQTQMQAIANAYDVQQQTPAFDNYYLTRLSYTYYDEYNMPGVVAYNQTMVNTAQANINKGYGYGYANKRIGRTCNKHIPENHHLL
jgi:hypothetical protein